MGMNPVEVMGMSEVFREAGIIVRYKKPKKLTWLKRFGQLSAVAVLVLGTVQSAVPGLKSKAADNTNVVYMRGEDDQGKPTYYVEQGDTFVRANDQQTADIESAEASNINTEVTGDDSSVAEQNYFTNPDGSLKETQNAFGNQVRWDASQPGSVKTAYLTGNIPAADVLNKDYVRRLADTQKDVPDNAVSRETDVQQLVDFDLPSQSDDGKIPHEGGEANCPTRRSFLPHSVLKLTPLGERIDQEFQKWHR